MEASRMSLDTAKAGEIGEFVRSRVNHSYNKEVFNKQLEEEM